MAKIKADSPIGVFDSGAGGLTVFKALRRRMPNEKLIYFGDSAHLPYGSKSKEAISRTSVSVARFLAGKGIKILVVACNTSSAIALEDIKAAIAPIPVVGVIEPGARAAAKATRSRCVGIVATEATIASGAYTRALKKQVPQAKVATKACPLFVPLVEEGWWSHPVTQEVAKHYLKAFKRTPMDVLILGCTHYPFLKKTLRKVLGPGIGLIDSAEETAVQTEVLLKDLGLRRQGGQGSQEFYASDGPKRFLVLARRFLGNGVRRILLHSFD